MKGIVWLLSLLLFFQNVLAAGKAPAAHRSLSKPACSKYFSFCPAQRRNGGIETGNILLRGAYAIVAKDYRQPASDNKLPFVQFSGPLTNGAGAYATAQFFYGRLLALLHPAHHFW